MTSQDSCQENKEPDLTGLIEPSGDDMVKIQASEQHCIYYNKTLVENLNKVKKDVLKKNWDCFLIVDGIEGSGKSTLASQVALFLDSTYNLDRCCFTMDQFINVVNNATKGQAVVFDETTGYLS